MQGPGAEAAQRDALPEAGARRGEDLLQPRVDGEVAVQVVEDDRLPPAGQPVCRL